MATDFNALVIQELQAVRESNSEVTELLTQHLTEDGARLARLEEAMSGLKRGFWAIVGGGVTIIAALIVHFVMQSAGV